MAALLLTRHSGMARRAGPGIPGLVCNDDSGFASEPVIGPRCARTRWTLPRNDETILFAHHHSRALRLEVRMNDGAVLGQRGGLDQFVVPIHRQGLARFVAQ